MESHAYLILVAETDNKWFEWITRALEKREYVVRRALNSKELFKICKERKPDLLILEQQMHEMDGIEITTEVRENPELRFLPIAFFTEQVDKYTQLAAFNSGADYFIRKGIKTKLFLARIGALLRRSYEMTDASSPVKIYGDILIDEDQFLVSRNGDAIELSKKEFQLLSLLASKPGKVFKRPNILARIWGDDIIVGDRNIDTHIKKLRKKIGKDYIKTARGIGYKFAPPDTN